LIAPNFRATAMNMASLGEALNAITAISTAIAAGFAAFSSFAARKSASAAESSVEEARRARIAEQTPRLVFERNFGDLFFTWPPEDDHANGEPNFRAHKSATDKSFVRPSFSFSNFGQTPALDVHLDFELDDPNGKLAVPKGFQELGLSVSKRAEDLVALTYETPTGSISQPPARTSSIYFPHVAPGQSREVEFPHLLLNRLFLRGIQNWQRKGDFAALTLIVQVNCSTTEGDECSTQFRFRAYPRCPLVEVPVIVLVRFDELPMYARERPPLVT
jgi:hypothetical protein